MINLAWDLVPVAFGVIASPLAIMALVAVLLSRHARVNGVLFLLGWALAVIIAVVGFALLLAAVQVQDAQRTPPAGVAVSRLLIGIALAGFAVWTYRRSRAALVKMAAARTPDDIAAAAPQLPGWMRSIDTFSPQRSLALGLGIFLLNPVNVSCAFIAALDVRLAELDAPAPTIFLTVFILVCIVPMAIPVVILVIQREKAAPALEALRAWIVKNNGVMSAIFLAVIAFMQIQKALTVLS